MQIKINEKILFILLTVAMSVQRLSVAIGNIFLGLSAMVFLFLLYKQYKDKNIFISQEYAYYYKLLLVVILSAMPMIFFTGNILGEIKEVAELWIYRVLPFYIITFFVFKNDVLKKGLQVLLISISIDSLVACAQVLLGISSRGWGLGGNTLILGSLVSMLIPVMLVVIFDKNFTQKEKKFAVFVLLCCVLGSIAGKCRSSWVTLILTLPLVLVPYGYKSKKIISSSVIFICLIGVFVYNSPVYYNRVVSITNATTDRSNSHRIAVWKTGIQMTEDYLLTGTGDTKYKKTYNEQYRPAEDIQGLVHMHNNILQFAVTGGIFYALGYLIFTFGVLYKNIREWIKEKNVYSLMIILIFTSYFIYGMFDYTMGYSAGVKILFYLLAVISVLKKNAKSRLYE